MKGDMQSDEREYDDPALQTALHRVCGDEAAPPALRSRVRALLADGTVDDVTSAPRAASSLRSWWARWQSPVYASIAAAAVVLGIGVTIFYGSSPSGPLLLVATCLAATAGLAAIGSIYGVLAAGMRVRDTLLPLLVLPMVAPVLIAATEAFAAAYRDASGEGWRWFGLLAAFACLYLAIGIFAFDPLLEES